jgi:FMN-dependent NADH-azoreductase
MKLLHLDSSVLGPLSVSRQVSAAIVERLKKANPRLDVTYRDLTATPLAHLSGSHLAAGQGATPDASLQDDIAAGQAVLEEFLAADIVVLGAPMYNFTIPSQLKAWIDRILVAGKTFKYSAAGVEGLAGNKRVIVAISRGGFYGAGTPFAVGERDVSALGVRLHRSETSRIHFRRWHPGRPRASREGRGLGAGDGKHARRRLVARQTTPAVAIHAAAGIVPDRIKRISTRRPARPGSPRSTRSTGRYQKITRLRQIAHYPSFARLSRRERT